MAQAVHQKFDNSMLGRTKSEEKQRITDEYYNLKHRCGMVDCIFIFIESFQHNYMSQICMWVSPLEVWITTQRSVQELLAKLSIGDLITLGTR